MFLLRARLVGLICLHLGDATGSGATVPIESPIFATIQRSEEPSLSAGKMGVVFLC